MLQGADAAGGERKIDRAAALGPGAARIGAPVPQPNGAAAMAYQHDTEQRAGEAGPDYVDRLVKVLQGISRNTCARRSPKTNTSSNRLYNGMGATRMTSGSRQSQTTPSSANLSSTRLPRLPAPAMRNDN